MVVAKILESEFVDRLRHSRLAVRLAKGAFWTSLGTIVSKAATIVASLCVARFCGKTEFGEYGMVINTASMLSTVCGMGMGTTVVKYVAELKDRDPERAGRILAMATFITWLMGGLIGGLFIASSDVIAEKVMVASHLAPLLRIAALGVILGIFNEVQLSSLTGCEAYQERAWISIGTGLSQSFLLILFSWKWGLRGSVVAFSIAALATVIFTTLSLIPIWRRYNLKRRFAFAFREWRVLICFSMPTILLLFLGYPVGWFTRTLLARTTDGYGHLAIINAASPWGMAIAFLISTIGTAMVPIISDLVGRGEQVQALSLTRKMFCVNSMLAIPLTCILCLCCPLILKTYGKGFECGCLTFAVIIAAHGIGAIYQPMWSFLVGSGRMWMNLSVVFATAIIQIFLAWSFVSIGSVGLAISELSTSIIRLIVLSCLLIWYGKYGFR